jgi:hypothetical protein
MPSKIYLSDIVNYNCVSKLYINLEMTRSVVASKTYSKSNDKEQLQMLKGYPCLKLRTKK